MFLFIESILLFDAVHWSQFDEDMSQFHCSNWNFLGQKLPNGYLDLAKLWDMASPSLTSKKWWKIHYKQKQESHERKGLQKLVKPMAKDWSYQTTIGNLDLFNIFDKGIIVMTVPEKVVVPWTLHKWPKFLGTITVTPWHINRSIPEAWALSWTGTFWGEPLESKTRPIWPPKCSRDFGKSPYIREI